MTDQVKDKPEITKNRQELMADNAALRKELEALRAGAPVDTRVAELEAELADLRAEKEGWLITTPNVLYSGVTGGVKFERGMAFIPRTREFPHRKVTPLKEGWFEQNRISPEEKARIKAREARSTAQIVVEELQHEFGYTVEYFDAARLSQARQVMDARSKEFDLAYEAAKSAESARKLAPGYVGG